MPGNKIPGINIPRIRRMPGIHRIPGVQKIQMPGLRKIPGAGERSYAYAKACGIIGKSFIGKRIGELERAGRLSELDRMVFPVSSRDLPEKELLLDLEKRITNRAVDSIISIVGNFSGVPEFLALLVRGYEYTDLKSAIMAALNKEKNAPIYTDIGNFRTVHFDAWPDIKAMIEGTEFVYLLNKKVVDIEEEGGVSMQTLLDRRYYEMLWQALFSLPGKDRRAAGKILADEISLRNSSWALRLRTYYGMSPDRVMSHLVSIPSGRKLQSGKKIGIRTLADEALRSLELPLDNYTAWSSWRWKEFVNPDSGASHWTIDPRYFQNAASRYLYRLARRHFRLEPFSLDAVFCFIKLKQFEEDILTSSAEGLSIGMSGRDVFTMLGVERE